MERLKAITTLISKAIALTIEYITNILNIVKDTPQ